jgi:aspartate/methionine/tyrosine aminotransferase
MEPSLPPGVRPAQPTPRLPDFRLETFFSRWEFSARHHLTASDAQTLTITELLALGTDDDRAAFAELGLGYVQTWGTPRLRSAVAGTYDRLDADQVLAFAGADEALYWVLQVFAGPGDHVVVTVPNYQAMESVPLACGADVTGVALRPDDGWRLDLDAVRAALRPTTRLVAVNFPNNPTGAIPDQQTWRALVELCEERGVRLLSDEVYRGLELDPARRLPQAADLSPTAISLNVLSKAYGLPGLRIGWLASQDRDLLAVLERHKHYTTICNAGPSEFLGAVALDAREAIWARNRGIIAENLPQFDAFFAAYAELFDWYHPDGSCVAYPRYRGPDGAEAFCAQLLQAEGVLLLPPSIYASTVAATPTDRFRIGVGRRDPGPALDAMERFLASRTISPRRGVLPSPGRP